MFLCELFKQTEWRMILPLLKNALEDNLSNRHEEIFNFIQSLPAETNTSSSIHVHIDFLEEENQYDIYGKKNNESTLYFLSLSTFEEWGHYVVSNETISQLSHEEIAVYCLKEMTKYGVTNESIHQAKDNFLKASSPTPYISETFLCPFCNGTKTRSNNSVCTSCNADGYIQTP